MNTQKKIVTIATLAIFITILQAAGKAETIVPLQDLQKRVLSGNPALKASGETFEAANIAVHEETARGGAQLFADTSLGPQHSVFARDLSEGSFHFMDDAGVRFPLYGAKASQREEVATAQAAAVNAEADWDQTKRTLSAEVSEAYVSYWGASREADLARLYSDQLARNTYAARQLRLQGLWTDMDYFKFLDSVEQPKIDLEKALLKRQEALATLRSIVGSLPDDFTAEEPSSKDACLHALPSLFVSAISHDAKLREAQAQIDRVKEFQRYAERHSVDAEIRAGVGTSVDVPNGVGYGANVGLQVAFPTHAKSADQIYRSQLEVELAAYEDAVRARQAEVTAMVQTAFDERLVAMRDIEKSVTGDRSAEEALRETKLRFENSPTGTLNDVLTQMNADYAAKRTTLVLKETVLTKTYELLFLAPDPCGVL